MLLKNHLIEVFKQASLENNFLLKENVVLKWVHRFGIDSLNDLLIHSSPQKENQREEENQEQIILIDEVEEENQEQISLVDEVYEENQEQICFIDEVHDENQEQMSLIDEGHEENQEQIRLESFKTLETSLSISEPISWYCLFKVNGGICIVNILTLNHISMGKKIF